MARYIHEYFEDEDKDLYYELEESGYALRNIDVDRSDGRVVAAVDRAEWDAARDRGELQRYVARYGGLAEGDLAAGLTSEHPYDVITAEEFELVWAQARNALETRM